MDKIIRDASALTAKKVFNQIEKKLMFQYKNKNYSDKLLETFAKIINDNAQDVKELVQSQSEAKIKKLTFKQRFIFLFTKKF